MKRFKQLFIVLIPAFMLLVPFNVNSCAPMFPQAVFTFQRHPDAPLKQYAEGNLGVVLPSFARSYLVIAYRSLTGRPLAHAEIDAALNYWRWKLAGGWFDGAKGPLREWQAARVQALGDGTQETDISRYRPGPANEFTRYANCQPDSFHTAAVTLMDRRRRFGDKSSEIREWVRGQDLVFSNCNSGQNIPAMVGESSPELLKADRRYQIAAAHFYARDFPGAIERFDQISQETGSPWRVIAPYLSARIMVREESSAKETPAFAAAESRLRAILEEK